MITVLGATGNTGGRVAMQLLAKRESVRVVGRDKKKLAGFAARGAELAVGDASDEVFLTHAFAGAEAAYVLIPPNLSAPNGRAYQDRVGESTARALRATRVKRVVFLSSQGAHLASGTGPIAGLHAQEARLVKLSVDLLCLRPAYFFENMYTSLTLVREKGLNGGAIAPDVKLAMIATRDIADAAADALQKRDFQGHVVRDLLGPRDLTMREATRILGERLGKPDLPYVQFSYADTITALQGFGISESVAESFAEMARAFNEGTIPLAKRTPESTTPTTFESFADELAAAFRAG